MTGGGEVKWHNRSHVLINSREVGENEEDRGSEYEGRETEVQRHGSSSFRHPGLNEAKKVIVLFRAKLVKNQNTQEVHSARTVLHLPQTWEKKARRHKLDARAKRGRFGCLSSGNFPPPSRKSWKSVELYLHSCDSFAEGEKRRKCAL